MGVCAYLLNAVPEVNLGSWLKTVEHKWVERKERCCLLGRKVPDRPNEIVHTQR